MAAAAPEGSIRDYVALQSFSRPILRYLDDPDISEICVNRPGEVWIEKHGEQTCYKVAELTFTHLYTFAGLVADYSSQYISPEKPILSATLPGGFRVQFVIPPASLKDHVVISIRKQTVMELSMDEYEKAGMFSQTRVAALDDVTAEDPLAELLKNKQYREFLTTAIASKKNIVVSGGTGTGKTTFLNACLKSIPAHERIITIEDVDELRVPHANAARLFYSRGDQGVGKHTVSELLTSCLRLRPDRILFGELRGVETYDYLESINTDHPGSITTIHSNSPASCLARMATMVLRAKLGLSFEEIKAYLDSIIDIVVQIERTRHGRVIKEIRYARLDPT